MDNQLNVLSKSSRKSSIKNHVYDHIEEKDSLSIIRFIQEWVCTKMVHKNGSINRQCERTYVVMIRIFDIIFSWIGNIYVTMIVSLLCLLCDYY